ncbi:MAG: energy transducer TonB [Balneola sp.]
MKLFFLTFMVFISVNASAQFSGEITYEYKIIPDNNSVNIDSLYNSLTGSSSVYVITDSYYKSTYYKNGEMTYSYTYHDETKRMYDEQAKLDYITYRDSRDSNLGGNQFEIFKDSTINILGYEAVLLKTDYNGKATKSYYSTTQKVNYETFKGHKVANWYNRLKALDGGILLKSITQYEEHTEILTAVNVTERQVSREEFNLPNDKDVVASFSALDDRVELDSPSRDQIRCYQQMVQKAVSTIEKKETITIYLQFILDENGEISELGVLERDKYGLYLAAIDILKNCGLNFKPGKINGQPVASETYFPVEF